MFGSLTGWQLVSNEFWDATNSTGIPFQYWCENLDGTEVEAGTGYLTATTTLVRDTAPEYTLSGGVSGSGTVVTFASGVKRVFAAPIGRGILPTLPTINTTAAASERLESTAFPVGAASTATLLNGGGVFEHGRRNERYRLRRVYDVAVHRSAAEAAEAGCDNHECWHWNQGVHVCSKCSAAWVVLPRDAQADERRHATVTGRVYGPDVWVTHSAWD